MSAFRFFDIEKEPMFAGLEYRLQVILDQARGYAGVPFVLTCGRRSPDVNASVGGVANSLHLLGLAADLHVQDSTHLAKMIDGLKAAGVLQFVIGVRVEGGKIVYHNLHVELDDAHPEPCVSVRLYGVEKAAA